MIIQGFRRFYLKGHPDELQGMRLAGLRQHWETSTLTAGCYPFMRTTVPQRPLRESQAEAAYHLSMEDEAQVSELRCGGNCGIYLAPSRPALTNMVRYMEGHVDAQVVAWGNVAEYDIGWRAEHVRIEKLWMLERYISFPTPRILSIQAQLARHYGVPVVVDEEVHDDLESLADDDWTRQSFNDWTGLTNIGG